MSPITGKSQTTFQFGAGVFKWLLICTPISSCTEFLKGVATTMEKEIALYCTFDIGLYHDEIERGARIVLVPQHEEGSVLK